MLAKGKRRPKRPNPLKEAKKTEAARAERAKSRETPSPKASPKKVKKASPKRGRPPKIAVSMALGTRRQTH
jgi:hypothetical protein